MKNRLALAAALVVSTCAWAGGIACAPQVEEEEEEDDTRPGGAGGTPGAGGGGGRGGSGGSAAGGAGPDAGGQPAGTAGAGGARDAGAGGAGGGMDAAPVPPPAPLGPVVITEVMYHPVLEDDFVDKREFLEIYNRSSARVSLAGWRLAGDVQFTFPADAALEPRQLKVIAKNRAALLALSEYRLAAADVLGDYMGQLDNGSGRVQLLDRDGNVVDVVVWRDEFPWPVAADALGAGDKWLRPDLLPLERHRFRGHSLERLSPDVPASEIANWDASALDEPSPGRPNPRWGKPIPAIVEALSVEGSAAGAPIRPTDQVTVTARLSRLGQVSRLRVELFVDDLARADEPRMTVDMTGAGGLFQARLPPQPANSIVRYRILGDRGPDLPPVITPRQTDPYDWHAYFVDRAADIQATSPVYQLFIAPADWGKLYSNSLGAHVVGCSVSPPRTCPATACQPNPGWTSTVDAVFVHQGRVYDVHARYQGSRYNRLAGPSISGWPAGIGPTPALSPMRALSWTLKFPRYRQFQGKGTLSLNKLRPNACWGLESAVAGRLYPMNGIPFFRPRFVRFYVNGAYYQYMMEWVETGETMARRLFPNENPPDIFESKGFLAEEGPYGIGDQRQIQPHCGHPPALRYQYTYDKKNNDFRTHAELIRMIDALHAARATNNAEMVRAYFNRYWDLDKLLTYVAIRNWSSVWDDAYHNHFLVHRSDGKWMMFAWDVDDEFKNPRSSPYLGDPSAPVVANTWNYVKETLFKYLRADFNKKMQDLIAGPLSASNFAAVVDDAVKDLSMAEAMAAPTWPNARCDLTARANAFKQFARDRNAHVPTALRP